MSGLYAQVDSPRSVMQEVRVDAPSDDYYLELLEEMRRAAVAAYELEITRLGWIISKTQIAFAVLGVGLTLLLSRLGDLCAAASADGGWTYNAALGIVLIGGALWLWAFLILVSIITASREPMRTGPPDPAGMHRELYQSDRKQLLASVAMAYDESAATNARQTDRKTRRFGRAFTLIGIGFVLVFLGVAGCQIEKVLEGEVVGARSAGKDDGGNGRRRSDHASIDLMADRVHFRYVTSGTHRGDDAPPRARSQGKR